jgi:hypothetical protein
MKPNYLKNSILVIAALAITVTTRAQNAGKEEAYSDMHNNYHYVTNKNGNRKESIQTSWHDKTYRMELVNHKMTELYVNDEKIPESKWGEYKTVIAEIREQIRKDEVQARKDQAQARTRNRPLRTRCRPALTRRWPGKTNAS